MTIRTERDNWMRELKASLMTRVAKRAMTTRTTGLDGLAKSMLGKPAEEEDELGPEFEHPDDWDRPID